MDPAVEIIFFWNIAHDLVAFLLNIIALIIIFWSWKRLGKADELRLPYIMSIVVTLLNLLALILVELPRLYSNWTSISLIFGIRLCQYLWIATPIIDVFQVHFITTVIFAIFNDLRKWVQFSIPTRNQFSRPIICIVLSLTCLGLVGLGRIYHPQVGKSGTMQTLVISTEETDCPVKISTIWTLCFRWFLGLLLPGVSILTLASFIKVKCWPRCSIALRSHIDFCISITLVNLLLQSPNLIMDIARFSSSISQAQISFSLHVLSAVLPKLNLSLYPLGILTILPWRQQNRRKSESKTAMEMMTEEDLKLLPINLQKSPSTNV